MAEGKPLKVEWACKRQAKNKCPLRSEKLHTRGVPPFRYGLNPELFIIAEAPGADEDELGEPMVGSAGKMLWKMLKKVGISSCYIGNTVCCRPPNNRTPETEEISACSCHVKQVLGATKPKVVMLAGATAANAFLGTKAPLKSLRGWHKMPLGDGHTVDAYVTYHPSAIHYNADIQSTVEEDLVFIKRRLQGKGDLKKLDFKWKYLDTLSKLRRAVDRTLRQPKAVGFDWEARSLDKVGAEPVSLAWGWGVNEQWMYSVPLQHPETPWSPEEYPKVLALLKKLFTAKAEIKRWIAHNSKFDQALVLDILGIRISNAPVVCSQQLSHVLDENRLAAKQTGAYKLENLAQTWLGISPNVWADDVSDALYSSGPDGRNLAHKISPKKICHHNCMDVSVTLKLENTVRRRAHDEHYDTSRIETLLDELPYLLGCIERNGVPVSLERLSGLRSDMGPIRKRKKEILGELGELKSVKKTMKLMRGNVVPLFATKESSGFPIRKREYLMKLFFEVLGLEPLTHGKKKTDEWPEGEPSVNKDFFNHYEGNRECQLVQEWRVLDKLETGYIDSWWEYASASSDSRIRSDYHGTGTTTGRLSNSNPNFQQIPKAKNEAAKHVKGVFMPDSSDGHLRLIVAADFSQAEVRWLAQIANEPVLRDMFLRRAEALEKYAKTPSKALADKIEFEYDLHRSTAAEIFGVKVKDITKEQRGGAKGVTFGLIYGQSDVGLADNLGIPLEEATELRDKWLGRFKKANKWFLDIEDLAATKGWVDSPIGRRRHLPSLLLNKYGKAAGHSRRVARNAPIQSVASDMNLWTAIKMQKWIDKYHKPWKLLALVHDSILAEVPVEDALEYIRVMSEIAHSPRLLKEFGITLTVPMEMEFEVGISYGECEKVTNCLREQEQTIDRIHNAWKKIQAVA